MERTSSTQTVAQLLPHVGKGANGIGKNVQNARLPYSWADDIRAVFFGMAQQLEPEFKLTDNNIDVYRNLVRYAFAQPDCEWDINRGIGLMGNTGSGKTFAMRLLSQLLAGYNIRWLLYGQPQPFSFQVVSARRMVSEFVSGGYEAVDRYIRWSILCIDDLGSEPQEVSYYGNRLNLFEHIIEERYLDRKLTHFTTNFNMEQLEQLYGQRVASRLYETCNIVKLVDTDWRRVDIKSV